MIFAAVAVVGGTALVVGRLLLRSQRIAPVSAQATMLGQTVIVRDEIGPGQEGLVAVHGELWRARSAHALAAGQPAVIEAVDGLVLTVAPPLAAGQPPAAQS
jgi:membrane-bound serine protease (ClpP class)